jgi:hypothetical protein
MILASDGTLAVVTDEVFGIGLLKLGGDSV